MPDRVSAYSSINRSIQTLVSVQYSREEGNKRERQIDTEINYVCGDFAVMTL